MHGPTIAGPAALVAVLMVLGCGSPRATSPADRSPGAGGPAVSSSRRPDAEQAAIEGIEELESVVAEARRAVGSASAGTATASADQQLRLSDMRRAIVAANVALQKARAAVGRGDYAEARQATLGIAEHLQGVLAKLRN
jgi:hypothetical protein